MHLSRRGAALVGLAALLAVTLGGAGRGAAAQVVDHVLGDPNAPVTIIEYASLTCPHCATFQAEVLPELRKRYIDTGKAKLIQRDFIRNELDLQVAKLANCGGPERYHRFIDVFMRQQASWSRAKDPVAAVKQLAKLGGMGEQEIEACLANRQLEEAVLQAHIEGEQKFGVNSTPTFIINGKKHAGNMTVDEFARVIEPLLN